LAMRLLLTSECSSWLETHLSVTPSFTISIPLSLAPPSVGLEAVLSQRYLSPSCHVYILAPTRGILKTTHYYTYI
jgi:hypothetical protein